MSNIIRGPQDYLLNSVTGAEVGMYVNSKGIKVLVLKKLGIEIPASTGTRAVINEAVTGSKQKIDLTLDWLWNGEKEYTFEIFVTRHPNFSGFTNDVIPREVGYQYKMKAFTTIEAGTLNDADTNTILAGLKAAIDADVQRTKNAVNSGAFVVATVTEQDGDALPDPIVGKLTLEAKTEQVMFSVKPVDFTQTQVTPFRKSTLTYDDMVRLFGIRAKDEGMYPDNLPTKGVQYMKVVITARTEGYDNVVASGQITREQVYNLYMPATAKSALEFATVTDANTNTNSMADSVGTKAKSFKDYLVYLCGAGSVKDN